MLRHLATVAVLFIVILQEPAYAKRTRAKRKRVHTPELVYKVAPSETIDARVKHEIDVAEQLLASLDARNVFQSPYLVSAIYYHDGFLSAFPEDRIDADPARRILAHITRVLTAEKRREFIDIVRDVASEYAPQPDRRSGLVIPVEEAEMGRRRRRRPPHQTALDLFAPEGSPVRSASSGVVVLSETNWNPADPFSTTSEKGGNTVIIFDAMTYRFYRYAHLQAATVAPGMFVSAGQPIGMVGHSGLNASQPKHGRHLHFEINQYDGRAVRPLKYVEIRKLLDFGR